MQKTILAVDDSHSIRQMMRFALAQQGYQIIEAGDGIEALEKMNGAKIDMVFTDLNMPRMDGLDLIRKLRSGNRSVPIVMLTTESQESKKAEGKAAGATGWIVKPFRPEQLVQITQRLIGV